MILLELYGRGGRIRTCDLLVPNQARYQASLRPDMGYFSSYDYVAHNATFNRP